MLQIQVITIRPSHTHLEHPLIDMASRSSDLELLMCMAELVGQNEVKAIQKLEVTTLKLEVATLKMTCLEQQVADLQSENTALRSQLAEARGMSVISEVGI